MEEKPSLLKSFWIMNEWITDLQKNRSKLNVLIPSIIRQFALHYIDNGAKMLTTKKEWTKKKTKIVLKWWSKKKKGNS